jgi:hypothetical protein
MKTSTQASEGNSWADVLPSACLGPPLRDQVALYQYVDVVLDRLGPEAKEVDEVAPVLGTGPKLLEHPQAFWAADQAIDPLVLHGGDQ